MARILIRRAEVRHRRVDVRIAGTHITDIGLLRPRRGELELDAASGALLPGLHDHHLHLLSLARASTSLRCGPPEVTDLPGLARVLRAAPGHWVRGIGYHESVAGIPDRHLLDRLVPERPVRVQHRGGALWLLNTRALTELDLLDEAEDGRLWRADALLHQRLAEPAPDLTEVGARLAELGITGVTDATPNLSADTVRLLGESGLPQRLHLLGAPQHLSLPPHVTAGPHKILPADHEPPDWDGLRAEINEAHARSRPVA
ncbi:MAG TPA: amidohydrolase family protein, partial [Pseudonocardiaceae bacterium]